MPILERSVKGNKNVYRIDYVYRSNTNAVNCSAPIFQGSRSVSQWMDKVKPLLSSTPLFIVIPQVPLLLVRDTAVNTRLWNTQQVCCSLVIHTFINYNYRTCNFF